MTNGVNQREIVEDWRSQAQCVGAPDVVMFPAIGQGRPSKDALHKAFDEGRKYCLDCPVRLQCLDAALKFEEGLGTGSRFGVWGGLDPYERAQLDARRIDKRRVSKCRNGHERTPDNSYVDPRRGNVKCLECAKQRNQRYEETSRTPSRLRTS